MTISKQVLDEVALAEPEKTNRIAFRYCNAEGEITDEANPNGSLYNIAGIVNKEGNVLGMMPHPKRACEALLGREDSRLLSGSVLEKANL